MASIQFWGVSSGINGGDMVDALLTSDKLKLQGLSDKQKLLTTKKNAWNDLKDSLTEINNLLKNMSKNTSTGKKVSASEEGYVSVKANSKAFNTSYDIEVIQTAQNHTVGTNKRFAVKEDLGYSGSLNINGTNIDITEEDSLQDIMNKINKAKDSDGNRISAKAYIVGGALTIEGSNGKALSVSGDSSLLSNLGLTKEDGSINTIKEQQNAIISVNGIEVSQATNKFTDVIEGVEIDVTKATKGPIRITISEDTDAVVENTKQLVNALNDIFSKMSKYTAYTVNSEDSSKSTKAILNGDSSVTRLKEEILAPLRGSFDGELSYLFEVGISTDRYGKLTLDEDKLKSALTNNPSAVTDLLFKDLDKAVISDNSNAGMFTRLRESIKDLTTGTENFFTSKTSSIDNQYKALGNQIDRQTSYIEKRRAALEAQFTAMEQAMSKINSQGSFLSQISLSSSSSNSSN